MFSTQETNVTSGAGRSFPTTHWSLVLSAGEGSLPSAQTALERLCHALFSKHPSSPHLKNVPKHLHLLASCFRAGLSILVANGLSSSRAATLWTGPNIKFSQSANSKSDVILAGKVVLTRGINQVLYNTAAGEKFAGASSPADIQWAFGTLTNFSTL